MNDISTLVQRVAGSIDDRRRWRAHRDRTKRLPSSHRAAVEALERYLMHYGAIARGDVLMRMLEDLADLFEQGAADGTPVRTIVGDDPVDFAEEFIRNYSHGQWIERERTRLVQAIDRAADGNA